MSSILGSKERVEMESRNGKDEAIRIAWGEGGDTGNTGICGQFRKVFGG
jgi:hypothetical protein